MTKIYATEELVAEHKASLLDAATFFVAPDDADFKRHLRVAGRLVSREKRHLTRSAVLTLQAGVGEYAAPADLLMPKASRWGVSETQNAPWCAPRAALPSLRMFDTDEGTRLELTPAPTAEQISVFGASYPFYYMAAYGVPDTGESDVTDQVVDLVLLRAKVEALRELSIRNSSKPVTLRDGSGIGGSMARNMTPPALYEAFLKEYQESP